ncbi:IS21 family transposase [Myxococcus sp. K38C18041901]|uniref:IS21 family transposase n=1 Tax=Myxococcus guangdongensis TaxID=2906760 RepID=UPI0020A6E240|nr:IS21 family transposase [Myxococcus guangdongensis]MCP3065875.1 IS21 family transposase [Myxococcus guangdongensis]
MGNVLSDEKQQQVIALGRLGWSLRRIEEATGVRRETASGYLKAAGVGVRPPRRWGKTKPANGGTTEVGPASEESSSGAKPANEGTTDAAPRSRAAVRHLRASIVAPYVDLVQQRLEVGRNARAVYEELVDTQGYTGSYISVRRFVRTLRDSQGPEAKAVIHTAPGEEAQVDYGEGPMVRHPETGKYRRTRMFVMTLGYSRKSVRLLCWKSSSRTWAQLHEEAFRRLGGVARTVVLDNLREGVLAADVYEPALNPLFRDVLAHYGATALPARVRHPDRKGKVESAVGHAQRTPLKGLRFESLQAAQAYLDAWEARWADTRIHGTTKRQVAAMFSEECPKLLPLPVEPFRYYAFGERVVHLDGHVEVEGSYYSVPPGHIGRKLHVQWDSLHVRLLLPSSGLLLREHTRTPRGHHRTREEDRPSHAPRTTLQLLERAARAGRSVATLCTEVHHREGETGTRRILGVLSLARKYGTAALDDACEVALEMDVPTYRFVRRYLERRTPTPVTLRQVDPLIRELTHYRDVIARLTHPTPHPGDTET